MDKSFDLVFYHAHCLDGAMAALVILDRYPAAKAIPINYGEHIDIEALAGKSVIFVDFCPPPDTVIAMNRVVWSLKILDHHKAAVDKFTDLWFIDTPLRSTEMIFDLAQSGAGLAMQEINPNYRHGLIVRAVEDRDLWKFQHATTKAVCAYLHTYVEDLEALRKVIEEETLTDILAKGEAILEYQNSLIASIAERARITEWHGHITIVIDAPPELASELGNYLLYTTPKANIAVIYSVLADGSGCKYSLRSRKQGVLVDVNSIANFFGGGGHTTAAGFTSPEDIGLCR